MMKDPTPAAADMPNQKPHLFLIDGYSFVFRAYYSLPPLTNPEGTPVGAVYGFTNMLLKLKNRTTGDNGHHMLVVFDAGKKTFRNEIYSDYKANRPPAPEDLIPQFPLVKHAAEAMGLPTCSLEGYEADDIIATYTKLAKAQNMQVTIVSSDKDLMQLVDDDVEMYDTMKDRRIGRKEVEEKFGVPPEQVLDILSLMGDSADNIPGVPGIGPKTATDLIKQFGSLDALLEQAESIPQKKRRESLIEYAEQARMSRDLATLCDSVAVEHPLSDLIVKEENPQTFMQFLQQQGFTSLITKLSQKHGIEPAPVAASGSRQTSQAAPQLPTTQSYSTITEVKALNAWLADVVDSGTLAIQRIEEKKNLVGLALAKRPGEACYIPLAHQGKQAQTTLDFGDGAAEDGGAGNQIPVKALKQALAPFCEDPCVALLSHNIKPLLHWFSGQNISALHDTMVMSYVLDGSRHSHDPDNLAQLHLGISPESPPWEKGLAYAQHEPEKVADYCCNQADITVRLYHFFRQQLFNDHMLTVYETIERPLINILATMEQQGITVNAAVLDQLSDSFNEKLKTLEHQIHTLAGHSFNIGSPKQMGEVLFEELGFPGGKKSRKTGAYSTGAEVLEELASQGHSIAVHILEWRMLSKLVSTYTQALKQQIRADDKRIHTTFEMTATSTGRLSSRDPNLQNIPIRTEEGRQIRHAFVAPEGMKLIGADYSQIELRLLAHMADITVLKQAFTNGQDIHALTASQVFNIPLAEIDPLTRRKAKAINFGIIYGQSAFGLAAGLGISRKEASDYIAAYFTQYPGIQAYMEQTKEKARERGYVTTLYGRKCYLNGILDKNPARRNFAERAAINAPLQGTAADIIKKAMIHIDRMLAQHFPDTRMILQVHDELIFETPEKEAESVAERIKQVMQQVAELSIPLTAEVAIGHHWGEIH